MAAPTLYRAAGDEFSTTLSSSCNNTDLTMSLNSATGLNASGGMLIIDEGVANKEEVIAYTSVLGTVITIPSGGRGLSGTTAYSHSSGATVTDVIVSGHVNNLITSFTAEHSEAGVHSAATVTSLKATTAEIETGTSDVKVMTPLGFVSSEYGQVYNSMSRQAIMNGNFDIWQRATSVTNPSTNGYPAADRWKLEADTSGATVPTSIVFSRQILTSGDIPNSYFFHRIAPNGAGSGFGVNTYYQLAQAIEFGTSRLCGAGKTVTISFYARSSIASKKLNFCSYQSYGTGGSPSATEKHTGTQITLTSNWTRYTYTFATTTLVGKTFGTNNDDFLHIQFVVQQGSTDSATYGVAAITDFGGSGNIDIAQVQLCSGDVALPFQPKSYGQELTDCQRYYEPGNAELNAYTTAATNISVYAPFKVTKRIAPTVVQTNTGVLNVSTSTNQAGVTPYGFRSYRLGSSSAEGFFTETWTASAEL